MNIDVRYGGQLRHALGRDHDAIELDADVTVADLIARLADRTEAAEHLIDDDRQPLDSLLIAIDDVQATLDDPLRDGATVTLLQLISGG